MVFGKTEEIAGSLARDKEETVGSPIYLEMTKQISQLASIY